MDSDIINTVVAYIRPFLLDAVVDALRNRPNFPGMSVSDARGFGRHGAHPPHRGETAEVDPFTPAVRIEITCRGQELSGIVETIRQTARTGHPRDGKIFISTAAWVCRIRTDEEGPDAVLGGS
ncbi:MAG TPA: P-II family nitrogen regulator [Thermoanaerobaculia bacterium]|nr:P-II family nitrogen regulator [Thermoanaerobaculia bacterium]